MKPDIQLIVGLGNPGRQYESTRHNAGYWYVECLLRAWPGVLQQKDRFFGEVGSVRISDRSVLILAPQTFMNVSGKSVQALSSFYRIQPHNVLIAHDELDISPGQVRLKFSGGHGGHNGLRDISRCLGKDFYRLRIGIGHPGHASQVTGHVLSKPSDQDRILIDQAIDRAVTATPDIISGEFDKAMQALHTRSR